MRVVNLGAWLPDGRVRIHWFARSEKGPIMTGSRVIMTPQGPLVLGGAVGYIACQPERKDIQPKVTGDTVRPVVHSDDVRAVTCPECLATAEAKKALDDAGIQSQEVVQVEAS